MFIYEEILQTSMAYFMRSSLVCAWPKVYLNTRLLIVASYNANKFYANIADADRSKNKSGWSLINTNWKNKEYQKHEYCSFFLLNLL